MDARPDTYRRTARRKGATVAAAVGALVAALALAGPAPAAPDGSRQDVTFEFTTTKPDRPAGAVLEIDYLNPGDPGAKPPAVRRVVTKLARGARYDTSVPGLCTASDAELMARGAEACPPSSEIGVGTLTIDSGFPGPARLTNADVDSFNDTNELIFLNTVRGTEARTVLRAPVSRRRTVSEVPVLPGTPPDGGSLDRSRFEDFKIATGRGAERRAYITTPPSCPRSGRWVNTVKFTYSDGVTQTVSGPSPCAARQDAGRGRDRPGSGRPSRSCVFSRSRASC